MMKIKCDMCGSELIEQGGLLFSPPINGVCIKTHLCIKCFNHISECIKSEALA